MTVLLRWLLRLVTLAVALSVVSVTVLFWIASRSIPDYDADWTVEGISAPVEIVRNTSAVPHIFGETDADVFFGLGMAHAQDRLWQMLMLRRTAQGRLSELFGPATVQVDDLMRRLDLDRYANASVAELEPETLAALEAYADGVNEWIRIVSDEALGRGAPGAPALRTRNRAMAAGRFRGPDAGDGAATDRASRAGGSARPHIARAGRFRSAAGHPARCARRRGGGTGRFRSTFRRAHPAIRRNRSRPPASASSQPAGSGARGGVQRLRRGAQPIGCGRCDPRQRSAS